MSIKNKIALVTGAANGIGFTYAQELFRNGAAHVAILDLVHSNGEGAVAKLNSEFGKDRAVFIPCDVANPKELDDGFKKTVDIFKGLDIVVNNAGILDESRWELMININVTAVVRGTLLGLQYMSKDKGGKGGVIVNISSIAGLVPFGSVPIYAATKHAVLGLTRSFAHPYHYERTGVRVLTMCPGVTDTPLISDATNKLLDIVDEKFALREVGSYPIQKVENVAHGMMHIIESAQNGTVWVSEGGEPIYEVKIPDRHSLKVPSEN